jgi:hypothetical protein
MTRDWKAECADVTGIGCRIEYSSHAMLCGTPSILAPVRLWLQQRYRIDQRTDFEFFICPNSIDGNEWAGLWKMLDALLWSGASIVGWIGQSDRALLCVSFEYVESMMENYESMVVEPCFHTMPNILGAIVSFDHVDATALRLVTS